MSYIIRPNPNQDIATQVNMVMSNENYFYDGEIITDQNLVTIPGYDKPAFTG
ncbi:MAG: hypothetical protein IPP34_12730 [Bacteroidetes bacterium]|nr:hypothetical protein [Bacteroidota bacterium]